MSLAILSVPRIVPENGTLPVTVSGQPHGFTIPVEVALNSGGMVAYGSFELTSDLSVEVCSQEHLFVLVTSGWMEIETSKKRYHISAGEAFVIPQGVSCQWRCQSSVKAIFSSCQDSAAPAATDVVRINLDAPRDLSPPYPKDMLVSGDPRQSGKTLFSDSTGRWTIGVWDSSPYHRKSISFPKNELMYFHCGSASFSSPDGSMVHRDRNAPFVVAKGYIADWNSQVYLFKTYCSDTM